MAKIFAKNVPWCLLILVAISTTCNVLVLIGNYRTAESIDRIGQSTEGWSNIGLNISKSLQNELDTLMVNLSNKLLDGLNHTLQTSKILNTVIAAAASAADQIDGSQATKAVSLLQTHMVSAGGPTDVLPGLLNTAIDKLLDKLLQKATEMLDTLLLKMKPVLEQVGQFMMKFGDKVQNVVEGFSQTLDKAQKTFDQLMSQMSGGGTGEEEMLHETFNLFDVSNTGFINTQDLKDVATLYSVSAFAGNKSDELMAKYDQTNDSRLDTSEFASLVDDPSLTNVMSVLLRQYSKKLVETAGNVAAAQHRDEIAGRVVDYLQLVVAKNLTKMRWIADALTNATLPLQFTADIMAEMALSSDDPGALTTQDVGEVVVQEMMQCNATAVTSAFALRSDPEKWVAEGYASSDQAKVIQRVTQWMSTSSPSAAHNLVESLRQRVKPEVFTSTRAVTTERRRASFVETDTTETDSHAALAKMAFDLGQRNMRIYLDQRQAQADQMYTQMFATKTSRILRSHLLGSLSAGDDQNTEAEMAVNSGVPAAAVTLQFAQWLAANASSTSERFQSMCFSRTKTSSNAIDSFANQIQGMVKKIQSFITMMKKYSTPSGIQKLETQIQNFASQGGQDLLKVVKKKIGGFVNNSVPLLNKTINTAIDSIGDELGHTVAKAIGTPLGEALSPVLSSIMAQFMNSNSSSSNELGKDLADLLGQEISEVSGDVLGQQLGKLLHDMINTLLEKAVQHLSSSMDNISIPGLSFMQANSFEKVHLEEVMSMLNDHAARHLDAMASDRSNRHLREQVQTALVDAQEIGAKIVQAEFSQLAQSKNSLLEADRGESALWDSSDMDDADVLSGIWTEVSEKLRSFSNVLPMASKALKMARQEVSKLASHLDSIFAPFQYTGPRIFSDIGNEYRMVWTMYFCLHLPLTAILVLYGFWAGGFLGGPGSAYDQDEGDVTEQTLEDEKTYSYRMRACWTSCCHCLRENHDTNLCFWSCIIVAQIFSLLVFIVALLFVILGGVKVFIAAGCQQIYVLNEAQLCGETLQHIREFLATFLEESAMDSLPKTCIDNVLLTCNELGSKMQTSAILTVVFGFLAALMSFQMIIESSVLHARAVSRRTFAKED
jgi:hypothetical protein